jgi:hypothetical protein
LEEALRDIRRTPRRGKSFNRLNLPVAYWSELPAYPKL